MDQRWRDLTPLSYKWFATRGRPGDRVKGSNTKIIHSSHSFHVSVGPLGRHRLFRPHPHPDGRWLLRSFMKTIIWNTFCVIIGIVKPISTWRKKILKVSVRSRPWAFPSLWRLGVLTEIGLIDGLRKFNLTYYYFLWLKRFRLQIVVFLV